MSSDSDLDPRELIGSEFGDDITESVLSAVTSLFPPSHLSELHIDIVGDYSDIRLWIELVEMHETCDRISGEIHECCRLEEDDITSCFFRDESLVLRLFPITEILRFSEKIHHHKPDIVPGIFIFFSWISETDDHFHGVKSIAFEVKVNLRAVEHSTLFLTICLYISFQKYARLLTEGSRIW